jgi:hypothetical protein
MTDVIPYTHWSYWRDRDSAERCRAELADLGFRVGQVERAVDPEPGEPPSPLDGMPWLLRAARQVEVDEFETQEAHVRAVVERFGGFYDYGEMTCEVNVPDSLDQDDTDMLNPVWDPDLPPPAA